MSSSAREATKSLEEATKSLYRFESSWLSSSPLRYIRTGRRLPMLLLLLVVVGCPEKGGRRVCCTHFLLPLSFKAFFVCPGRPPCMCVCVCLKQTGRPLSCILNLRACYRVRFFKTGLRVCGLSNLFENEIDSLQTVNISPQSVPWGNRSDRSSQSGLAEDWESGSSPNPLLYSKEPATGVTDRVKNQCKYYIIHGAPELRFFTR